jgi:hypothetical protein
MGSPSSGNFGHAGRPGEVGGSISVGDRVTARGYGKTVHTVGHSTNAIVTKNPFSTQHERTPDRRVGGSSMESTSIPAEGVTFDKPVRVVVSGKNGYRTRTAEDVVGINVGQKDIVFQRRYPGGRVIPSPYRHANITNIKIRSSHSNPERNYHLQ